MSKPAGTCLSYLRKESGPCGTSRLWTPPKALPEGNSLEAEDQSEGPEFRAQGM